jgi:hypothetical protein
VLKKLYALKIFIGDLFVRESRVVGLVSADLVESGVGVSTIATTPPMLDPSGDELEKCGHLEPLWLGNFAPEPLIFVYTKLRRWTDQRRSTNMVADFDRTVILG